MKYAISVYETEQDFANREKVMPAYAVYSQALSEAGVSTGEAALQKQNCIMRQGSKSWDDFNWKRQFNRLISSD
jgi:hypothetical protein